jgi:hypothetical protein
MQRPNGLRMQSPIGHSCGERLKLSGGREARHAIPRGSTHTCTKLAQRTRAPLPPLPSSPQRLVPKDSRQGLPAGAQYKLPPFKRYAGGDDNQIKIYTVLPGRAGLVPSLLPDGVTPDTFPSDLQQLYDGRLVDGLIFYDYRSLVFQRTLYDDIYSAFSLDPLQTCDPFADKAQDLLKTESNCFCGLQ